MFGRLAPAARQIYGRNHNVSKQWIDAQRHRQGLAAAEVVGERLVKRLGVVWLGRVLW